MYVAKMCGICIAMHTKCGLLVLTLFLLPLLCGDMDINQLETYGH